jgi:hypothetical protein
MKSTRLAARIEVPADSRIHPFERILLGALVAVVVVTAIWLIANW